MAILITGGAGYIGSHTCIALLEAGYDIVVVDNLANSSLEALRRVRDLTDKDFRFYRIDMLDKEEFEYVFVHNDIEAVIHFAGLKAVGESVMHPIMYYDNNITSTLNLCHLMKKYGVSKLVFSSSATVYGLAEKMPLSEDAQLGAVNPYGKTKQMIETILRDMQQADASWSIIMLRYFNPIGAHPSGLIGEAPQGIPNNLMPYITQVAVGKLDRLHIYGNDYPTPDGTGVRDYIHVVDLANGHVKALQKTMQATGIDAINLGTGRGYSVLEVIAAFERASGRRIPYTFAARRPGDAAVCYSNPLRAEQTLGWVAEFDLDTMCEDAWRWQVNNPHGYELLVI